MKDIEELRRATHEAIMDPKAGDLFHEMYTHLVFVVKVTRKYVWTMSASAPCTFPEDAILEKRTREEFRKKYSYNSPRLENKYWVELYERGSNVEGWMIDR